MSNPILIADTIGLLSPILLGAGSIALVLISHPRRRGTTLVAPAAWAVFSLLALTMSECLLAFFNSAWLTQPLRFAAATTTVCPAVALLGAKRPQNRAWQLIVASLWGIFLLTSLQAVVFYRGEPLALFAAWRVLLLVLIVVGATNYVGTRFWLPSFVAAAGQAILLRPYLPGGYAPNPSWTIGASMAMFGLALGLAVFEIPRRQLVASPLDRLWCDFRDAYGVVWALRVAQRVRSECRLESAQVHDAWRGISRLVEDSSDRSEGLLQTKRTLASLLKRFVSADWLEKD